MPACGASMALALCGSGCAAIPVTSPGMPSRAAPPAGQRPVAARRSTIRYNGGFTFAERPELEAPEARIIWRAELDPGTLTATARPTSDDDPDGVDPAMIAPWLTVTADRGGTEHAVLSDGWHHIRLDLDDGSLMTAEPIILTFRLRGVADAMRKMLPLRRLLDLCRHHRFAASLFPRDRRLNRLIALLQVHDALVDGASQREIAVALFGPERVAREWSGRSDSLRSRTRRMVRDARDMAGGGYRVLLSEWQSERR